MESLTLPAQRKTPRPRADALRNRERIVTAAREMLTEFGPEVPLDEIARRAGVGNATVYRHFPDRQALVREVVCSVLDRTARAGQEALDEGGDPFAALERFVHASADERVSALCPMMAETFDEDHPDLAAASGRVEEIVTELMDRAKSAGLLREDVGPGDVMIVLAQLSRPPAGIQCVNSDRFVHRHLQLLLDGLRTSAASTLPGSPMTIEEIRRP
ncbi:TetR/AcrR family transcriptional regulator [Streptomyces sp. 4F14]|uniref:TetR/AcrR family transcriptional regulator n=1 Tax=Streptomyces sp. 4F14 TaxID=3394380 RepID=UPI003A8A8FF5